MKQKIPKRVVIIGNPGSGKSTFATKLGHLLNISVHHLDAHMFIGNVKRDKQEFLKIQQMMIDEDSWIIEGCSISTLGMRFARSDMIVYLDFPRLLCIWRVCKRALFHNKDLAYSGCANFVNWVLIKYIWNFKKEKGVIIEELFRKHSDVNCFIFRSSSDTEKFLEQVNRSYGKSSNTP